MMNPDLQQFRMFNFSFQQQNPRHKSVISTAPLSSLKKITAKNLVIGEIHLGCFIKLTIKSAFQMAAVQIEAYDSNKQIITLSVYNFPFEGKSYQHYFYQGVVLYVKEPFYKVTMSGILGIRVDDPSDVEFEKDVHKNNSIEDKKAECRELVKNAKYIEAYSVYDKLLKQQLNDKDKNTILINKAIVCFQLNLKQEYKENIEKALKIDPNNQKAHFHLIKANTISLEEPVIVQRYQKLRQNIQQNKNLSEQSKKDLNEFVGFHQSFQTNQKIDWHKAIKTQKLGQFWNPKIKVDKSPYGRGIFATQTILPGEFLIIEKALAWNRFQRTQNLASQGIHSYMIMHMKNSDRFASKIMPLFKLSGQLQNKLFTLSSKYYPGNKVNAKNRPKDRDQIESIFQTNAFTDYQLTNIFDNDKKYNQNQCFDLIYQKICLINHQCENNCDRFNIGTSGIIYATRQIKSGEQLSIIYKPIEDVRERQQALKHWGIHHCRCLMCREQRGEHVGENQGQSYSKYYFQQTYEKTKKNSLSLQIISKKIFGLFLVANFYKQSLNNLFGDQMLAQLFNLDQIQLQDLKNTFK